MTLAHDELEVEIDLDLEGDREDAAPKFTETEELKELRRYLGVFNRFTHYWFPRGKTQATPLCDAGLVYRDKLNVPKLTMRDEAPSCPACRKRLAAMKGERP